MYAYEAHALPTELRRHDGIFELHSVTWNPDIDSARIGVVSQIQIYELTSVIITVYIFHVFRPGHKVAEHGLDPWTFGL